MTGFDELGVRSPLLEKLTENGIVSPTPIQKQALPPAFAGRDLIGRSQTGTGKTFAFLLPILAKADPLNKSTQALIVTPTRELALQVTTETNKLLSETEDLAVLSIYGGQDVTKQINELQGNAQIVIGTPGRLLDHLRRGTIDLTNVNQLVLDEADQMLHIGFWNEVEQLLEAVPAQRQLLLFSATIPEEVRLLAKRYMNAPVDVRVADSQPTVNEIKQIAVETTDRLKQETLVGILRSFRPYLAIIFCRTKRRTKKLNESLLQQGFLVDELHGDLSQTQREAVMDRFRNGEIQFLVATDVAARGLDVEGISHVFNYDIPLDAASYIHRIGRTGRAGGAGLAVTLYARKDYRLLGEIEGALGYRIKKRNHTDLVAPPKRKQVQQESQQTPKQQRHKKQNRPY